MQFGLKGETIKKAKRKRRRGRGGEGGFAAVREGRRKEARKAMSIIPCSVVCDPPPPQHNSLPTLRDSCSFCSL